MPILNMIYGSGGGSGWLPSTYQEVEYIQTTGTQWTNTGYTPQQWDTAEIKFNMLTLTWDEQRIFSLRQNNWGWRAWRDSNTWDTGHWFTYNTTWFDIDIIATGTCPQNATTKEYIFAQNERWNVYHLNKGTQRLYYCKIYRDWNLIHNYIPCYRKSDNEIWLFDIVDSNFFTNFWTWTFIKWNDV